jgi:hypothetical protein
VLILAGGADHLATVEEARDLHARVESHGRLVIFDGAAHTKMLAANPALYWQNIGQLLEAVVEPRRAHETTRSAVMR